MKKKEKERTIAECGTEACHCAMTAGGCIVRPRETKIPAQRIQKDFPFSTSSFALSDLYWTVQCTETPEP